MIVLNVEDGDDRYNNCVCNGMEGMVRSVINDGEKYVVAFSNLESDQEMLAEHLQKPDKVHYEENSCRICGSDAKFLCSRCNMARYCSKSCQLSELKNIGSSASCCPMAIYFQQ